jgi:hypothetical protein
VLGCDVRPGGVLEHANGRPGIFSSTAHPGATRRYRMAGFSLHPQMRMVGTVDRSTLPAVRGLREGDAGDFEWMDRLDRDLRGAGARSRPRLHARHLAAGRSGPQTRAGLRLRRRAGQTQLLAAAEPETARKLLWGALAESDGDTLVNCITTANDWAIDVGLAARLQIGQEGYIGIRDLQLPAPYLASGHFL